jgi:hypothetical protein
LLTDGEVENPAFLEDIEVNDSSAGDVALDLALGCQRLRAASQPEDARLPPRESGLSPPVLFDNVDELRTQYEAALSEYRAQRTYVVNALIMLSFFGGLALALLVTMLALLRIVWGSRLWLPTIVATVCCVVVTAVSNEPSRMKPVEATAVGFAPCLPLSDAKPIEQSRAAPANVQPATAANELRSLAEKVSKMEGDAEGLKSDRFVVRQYARPESAADPSGKGPAKPLGWYPLLTTGPDGRVTVPGLVPAAGKRLRLRIDAHSDGRIESCELMVK